MRWVLGGDLLLQDVLNLFFFNMTKAELTETQVAEHQKQSIRIPFFLQCGLLYTYVKVNF